MCRLSSDQDSAVPETAMAEPPKPALFIPDAEEDVDLTKAPTDAREYLLQVRYVG